jgi:DNA-binding beta-propeller fold protein YncE
MKSKIIYSGILGILMLLFVGVKAQTLKPKLQFDDDPRTHNVHVASDGQYLYTVNGGKAYLGQISKFTLDGKYLTSYDINLDMRSLMYNNKDKKFYVCTFEKDIFRVTDMEKGTYELVLGQIYDNEQANLAMSPDGKYIYYFNDGIVKIFKFPSGKLSKTIKGLDKGSEFTTGNSSVAVDDKHIYTWNSDYKLIFVYDLKGKKIKSAQISKGEYGFSLSCANGLIFVSTDGDYKVGKWYGYDLWNE